MPFQKTVNTTPAPAVDGDFASVNPMSSVVAPESGFVAGAGGVTVGRFAWISADGKTLLNTGAGKPDGFIPRLQSAQIGTYLAEFGNNIPAGFPVDLMRTGDFYSKSTVAAATKGDKAFAKFQNGTMQPDTAAATIAGASVTASVATNVLTVTAVGSGAILVGSLLSGASIPPASYIAAQLTGTAGGVGTYSLSTTPGTVVSATVTTTDYVETDFVIGRTVLVNELTVMSK